jgi:hypothetical protein
MRKVGKDTNPARRAGVQEMVTRQDSRPWPAAEAYLWVGRGGSAQKTVADGGSGEAPSHSRILTIQPKKGATGREEGSLRAGRRQSVSSSQQRARDREEGRGASGPGPALHLDGRGACADLDPSGAVGAVSFDSKKSQKRTRLDS